MKKHPVWVLGNRDAAAFSRGKTPKNRPCLVAEFDTEAEAAACIQGVRAAMHAGLRSVNFLADDLAKEVDKEVLTTLAKAGNTYAIKILNEL